MLIYLQVIDDPKERSRFEELYRTYRRLMFHVAREILGNDQDAEDAVQEAFLSIAKNFEKISTEERHKTKAFVVIVVRNKAINLLSQRKRHITAESFDETSDITTELLKDDGVAQCMMKLPVRYRDFLGLKYVWGYDNRELAAFLGLSEAGIRKLNQRAKSALEKLCREEGLL